MQSGGPPANQPRPPPAISPQQPLPTPQPMTVPPPAQLQLGAAAPVPRPALAKPAPTDARADATPPKGDAAAKPAALLREGTVSRLALQIGGPKAQVSREVEAVLSDLVESFVDSALTFGAGMAAQRNSRTVEPRDLAVHLERSWYVPMMVARLVVRFPVARLRLVSVPGYPALDPNRPVKRPPPSLLHRSRAAAVRRQVVADSKDAADNDAAE